jgi:ring-1,2-phenylacetyl-CoA epoxidase subunit PaaA
MVRICKEESFHQRQGFEAMTVLCRGTEAQRRMAQAALDRWWFPSLMMFGPPDSASAHSQQSMRWGIKRFSNDELRQRFIDVTTPQAEWLGLTVPEGEIDWDEFARVIRGDGPCNRQRMDFRQRAHADGAWVREAAAAYAAKRRAAEKATA